MADTDVTVVVITHRAAAFIDHMLSGLRAQTHPHDLLVIDNDSRDGTADILARSVAPHEIRRMPRNLGFAGGVAAALPLVHTKYLALLNDDAVPDPDWLEQLVTAARGDDRAAAWTSLMVLADRPDTVNNIGSALNERWYGVDVSADQPVVTVGSQIRDVFGFCGGAALLRTAAVRAVGGFPAEFFLYYEDLDTSWRLRRAGWQIRAVPRSRVAHRHAATSDRRSEMFHYYNERNRLLTLVRCAPLAVVAGQFVRFALTTASLTVKRWLGRPIPPEPNFGIGLRLRVFRDALTMVPTEFRRRRPAVLG